MSNTIFKIAKKCHLVEDTWTGTIITEQYAINVFAEQIVKECITIVSKVSPDRPYMVAQIKEHFGIKE